MKDLIFASVLTIVSLTSWAGPTAEQLDRNDAKYNLEGVIGLKGYDPVSYFTEGGGHPQKGLAAIEGKYGDVTYFFASDENRNLFFANPTKFEPTYGGWCAWAMANEAYADIDPELYTINGNRLHFFISRGAKARFDRDLASREADDDNFWKGESGETPRK